MSIFASLPDQYVISPSDIHEALLNIKVHIKFAIKFASLPDQYVISPSDAHEALLNIKVHKAPGPDDIPNWLL